VVRKHESTKVRQRQIIDAARKVLIRYGTEHITVRRIAREAGISEAAVYRHFKSKRDVLSLLADHIEGNLVGDVTRATVQGYMPLETLDSVLRSHLSTIEQRRGISFQVITQIVSLGDKKLNGKMSHTIDRYKSCLKDLLAEGVESGEVRGDIDLEAATTALYSMMQGLVSFWALNNYSFNLQEKYAALWSIFREAVIKR
jgi:AcrR family transcriptional regulator